MYVEVFAVSASVRHGFPWVVWVLCKAGQCVSTNQETVVHQRDPITMAFLS
jgi:hypothetical protein